MNTTGEPGQFMPRWTKRRESMKRCLVFTVLCAAVLLCQKPCFAQMFAGFDQFCSLPVIVTQTGQGAVAGRDRFGNPVIYVDPGVIGNWTSSRMFALAHECGHHMLGHSTPAGMWARNWATRQQELAADCWAAQQLVSVMGTQDLERQLLQFANQGPMSQGPYPSGWERASNAAQCAGIEIQRRERGNPPRRTQWQYEYGPIESESIGDEANAGATDVEDSVVDEKKTHTVEASEAAKNQSKGNIDYNSEAFCSSIKNIVSRSDTGYRALKGDFIENGKNDSKIYILKSSITGAVESKLQYNEGVYYPNILLYTTSDYDQADSNYNNVKKSLIKCFDGWEFNKEEVSSKGSSVKSVHLHAKNPGKQTDPANKADILIYFSEKQNIYRINLMFYRLP